MKRVSFLIVFMGIFLLSASYEQPQGTQGRYYYAFDEKIFLVEVPNKVVVSFENSYLSEIQQFLQNNAQIRQMEFESEFGNCVLSITENTNSRAFIADLKKSPGIKSVNPLYNCNEGGIRGLTNEIVIQFKEGVSHLKIDEIYKKYRLEILDVNEVFQVLSVPIDLDPLDVANAIQRSGLTNFSCPNFLTRVELSQSLPVDPYFVNQYYLRNTGQIVNGRTCTAGADINVVNAWNITKGNNNIVIAVLDEGVTSNHPDLPNSRQMRLNGSNFAVTPPGNDPSPVGNDNHGNACAGIIAASHNNEGIAGIAPNCIIMPVRIRFGLNIPATEYANAIRFAANNGADVISNSWNYGSTNPNLEPPIVAAIQHATTNGRNGRGCVVVFSAGNTAHHADNPTNPGIVAFPANVNIAGVLTVGASDRNDFQANYSPTSNLGSPNNQIIDVVAPSHRAYSGQIAGETRDVWTIDIPGAPGDNPVKQTDGGALPVVGSQLPNTGTNHQAYTGHFGGTSAAAPQVAGVAALMLSVNPNLTQLQVATMIRSTARKARAGTTYNYQTTAGRPNGTWNAQMGYGVLNAHAAISAVPPFITGPVIVCSSPVTFTVANTQPGFTWSKSSNLSLSGTGNSVSVMSTGASGPGWVSINQSGFAEVRHDVWVGLPSHASISGPSEVSTYTTGHELTYYAEYSGHLASTSYYWYMDGFPGSYYFNGSTNKSSVDIVFTGGGFFTLFVEAINVCGASFPPGYIDIYNWGRGYLPSHTIYPNPVSDILHIEIDAGNNATLSTNAVVFDIRLYDGRGNMLRQTTTHGGTVQFRVSDLPEGMYFLHIYDGVNSTPEIHQIVVEH